jgi:hypothetical protein
MTTLIPKFDLKDGGATPTGAVNRPINEKLSEFVSVLDFGADPTGIAESTTAFTNAQTASKCVYVPEGTYLLDGLRIQNKVKLIGAGAENVIFNQKQASVPAIDCTSDVNSGGILDSLELSGFTVVGATSASVQAVRVQATGIYAIWRSKFDFVASSTYGAITIGGSGSNVFDCQFNINSQESSGICVNLNGGAYNRFNLFLVRCRNYAVFGNDGGATFERLVCDERVRLSGQNTVLIQPAIEELEGTTAWPYVLTLEGFNQTAIEPVISLNSTSAAKVSSVFSTFSGTTIIAPQILGTGAVTNPFVKTAYPLTIIGPARSACTNKMEVVFDGSASDTNLRNVTFVGDVSALASQVTTHNGRVSQYAPTTGSFNLNINPNTDAVIIEPTGTIALMNVGGYGTPLDGQVLSFTSTQTITTIAWTWGHDNTLLPTTIAANTAFSIIYKLSNDKFYPI